MVNTQELLKYLSTNDIEFSVLKHPHAKSAEDISFFTHLPVRYIVQSIPMQIDGNNWMAVIAGGRKVNYNAISRILQAKKIFEGQYIDWMQFFPHCDFETIPPFGNLYGFSVLADRSLQEGKRIIFSACSNTQSIFMRWDDYYRLVQPVVAGISIELAADSELLDKYASPLKDSLDSRITSKNPQEMDGIFQSCKN